MKKRGFRVGLLDLDLSGPTLDVALGVNSEVMMDRRNIYYYPVEVDGMYFMGLGLLIDKDKVLMWGGEQKLNAVRELYRRTLWDKFMVEYLIIDMPPSSAEELKVLLTEIKPEVVVLITTPSKLAYADFVRVRTALKFFKIPYITVVNMGYRTTISKGEKKETITYDKVLPDENYFLLPFDFDKAVSFDLDMTKIVDEILRVKEVVKAEHPNRT